MPKKYHIHVAHTESRFPQIGRSGIIDWGEGCLKCAVCVKQECIYGVYRNRRFSPEIMGDTIDQFCKNCFRCVQGCPKRLIHKTINPEWEALGDDVYTPEIITVNWQQAESGKIPVSGAGFGGAFSGAGFDSMWTDMSEIVRPTRDGIHGREYISTVVDVGGRPPMLRFDERGRLASPPRPSLRLPLPIIFNILPFGAVSSAVYRAMAMAARELGTRMLAPPEIADVLTDLPDALIPAFGPDHTPREDMLRYPMVELVDGPDVFTRAQQKRDASPTAVIAVRTPAVSACSERTLELVRNGIAVVHCTADERGLEPGGDTDGLHIKDNIEHTHRTLLDAGVRDEVTLIASGGIAMAEHVVKSMLCGANLVAVDIPLLIALECRVCRNCHDGGECPARVSDVDPNWARQRIVNLMGAWHNQILEMMGAMGIREARRLRGERGRIMHFADLESDVFAKLFAGPDG